MEAINARALARKLGCSTKPIFSVFANMEALKDELIAYINRYFGACLAQDEGEGDAFLQTGLAYIDFAKQERQLFKILFLSDNIQIDSFTELVHPKEHAFILKDIQSPDGGEEGRQALFMNIWLYVHGMATMIAANGLALPDEEVRHMMKNVFHAFYAFMFPHT
jgi:hypothetical protein